MAYIISYIYIFSTNVISFHDMNYYISSCHEYIMSLPKNNRQTNKQKNIKTTKLKVFGIYH